MLCCVVLCCAVLCCAALCCALLCCAALCCAVLCCAVRTWCYNVLTWHGFISRKRGCKRSSSPLVNMVAMKKWLHFLRAKVISQVATSISNNNSSSNSNCAMWFVWHMHCMQVGADQASQGDEEVPLGTKGAEEPKYKKKRMRMKKERFVATNPTESDYGLFGP